MMPKAFCLRGWLCPLISVWSAHRRLFRAWGSNLATTWLEINADAFTGTVAPELGQGTSNRSLSATADASIHPGDCLDINLALNSATGTDAVNIYGIEIWYRSNLAFSDINSR
jgi:hypothetical protein